MIRIDPEALESLPADERAEVLRAHMEAPALHRSTVLSLIGVLVSGVLTYGEGRALLHPGRRQILLFMLLAITSATFVLSVWVEVRWRRLRVRYAAPDER